MMSLLTHRLPGRVQPGQADRRDLERRQSARCVYDMCDFGSWLLRATAFVRSLRAAEKLPERRHEIPAGQPVQVQ